MTFSVMAASAGTMGVHINWPFAKVCRGVGREVFVELVYKWASRRAVTSSLKREDSLVLVEQAWREQWTRTFIERFEVLCRDDRITSLVMLDLVKLRCKIASCLLV